MDNRISHFHRVNLPGYIFSITFLLSVNSVLGALGISNFASEIHFFTENQGQFNDKALFRAKIPGGVAWFTSEGVTYSFSEFVEDCDSGIPEKLYGFKRDIDQEKSESHQLREYLARVVFVGANSEPEVLGLEKLEFVFNYFIGNDESHWRTHVPNYSAIIYRDLYPGIDLKYEWIGGQLEYSFLLAPGADPTQIRLRYENMESMIVSYTGDLIVQSEIGYILERFPEVFQVDGTDTMAITASFEVFDSFEFGFKIDDSYKPEHALVIDPIITYGVRMAGSEFELGPDIDVDDGGNVFLSAVSFSQDFPVLFPYQSEKSGQADIIVSKFDGESGALIFSTYWGGSGRESWLGTPRTTISVASSGNPFVGGITTSTDLPVIGGVAQTYSGGGDGFVFGLSSRGDSVVFSSYVGGSSSDALLDMAFDRFGFLHIVGSTSSSDFDTVNALQTTLSGFSSGFVRKLEPLRDSIAFSTYFGGSVAEGVSSVAIDELGRLYIAGWTESRNFPLKNPIQDKFVGTTDGFIAILSENGDSILFSTYLGGSGSDNCKAIVVDIDKNFYVCGSTASPDFPVPAGSLQPEYGGGCADGFIFKFAPLGSAVHFGTFIGGNSVDLLLDLNISNDGSIITGGVTGGGSFEFVPGLEGSGAFVNGLSDGLILGINTDGDSILYAGSVGGQGLESVNSLAIGPDGEYYIAGRTNSPDFERLELIGNLDSVHADIFLLRIDDLKTAAEDNNEPSLPKSFALHQNYPNPFNPTTNVRFVVPFKSHVVLEVFNVLGQRVVTLEDRVFSVGEHISVWNAELLPSGVYYIRLQTKTHSESRPAILLK